jgi:hypothetical protein
MGYHSAVRGPGPSSLHPSNEPGPQTLIPAMLCPLGTRPPLVSPLAACRWTRYYCRSSTFVSASCSCDNRLWVMTTPVTTGSPAGNQGSPHGTLEAPLPPVRGFFFRHRLRSALPKTPDRLPLVNFSPWLYHPSKFLSEARILGRRHKLQEASVPRTPGLLLGLLRSAFFLVSLSLSIS